MTEPDETTPLNANQRRHFAVVLASLENALVRVEQLARAGDADERSLTRPLDDLPPRFAARLAPLLDRARMHLHALARATRVEVVHPSVLRTIRALLTSQIVHLEDSDVRRLRAYGDVDPRVAGTLEPALHDLQDVLREMLDALRHHERRE